MFNQENTAMIIPILDLMKESIDHLVVASENEGFNFLRRLVNDWKSGKNRFNQEGEGLYKLVQGDLVIGLGGINRDPYNSNVGSGRLRRLYILPKFRKQGFGYQLVQVIIAHHRTYFSGVTLKTDNPEAARFYEKKGFLKIEGDKSTTHRLEF